jgi:hypothetical protein
MMRRILLLVTVAVVMTVMLVCSALPALAAPPAPPPSGGVRLLCTPRGRILVLPLALPHRSMFLCLRLDNARWSNHSRPSVNRGKWKGRGLAASALSLALIHPTSGKRNSPKSISTILHKTTAMRAKKCAIPPRMLETAHHILWQ